MVHKPLENTSSTAPMLPKDDENDKPITPKMINKSTLTDNEKYDIDNVKLTPNSHRLATMIRRRNFLSPNPTAPTLEELNNEMEQKTTEDPVKTKVDNNRTIDPKSIIPDRDIESKVPVEEIAIATSTPNSNSKLYPSLPSETSLNGTDKPSRFIEDSTKDPKSGNGFVPPSLDAEKLAKAKPINAFGGKTLIREDTVFTLHGCTCGKGQLTCSGVKQQWSVLCWGRLSDRRYYTMLLLLSFTFVLSLLGTVFFCFTNTLDDAILSSMVIREDSLAYSIWKRPNVNPLMKVHLFNYTNWQQVKSYNETTLKIEEVGPYVYSQQLERVNVKFDEDLLTFQERNEFQFVADETVGANYDQVFVPNLPLLGAASMAKTLELNTFEVLSLNTLLLGANHRDAFVKLPVHRFLWGYEDSIVNVAKTYFRFNGKANIDQFGLLAAKNGTVSERFTINTGQKDIDKMNLIQKVDGQSHLTYWNDVECNKIAGSSDGSIFPPSMLDKKQTLYVFYPNLCRRLPFVFEKEVETYDGIILYRYRMPRDVFDDPSTNPSNQCYCEVDAPVCPPKGVINITACTMGAPAMASFPHFYLGSPELQSSLIGLRPNASIHDTHVDIHPKLGIALQGRSTLQINIEVRKPNLISSLSFLPNGLILPVAWIEMEVEELPPSMRRLVYHGTYSTAALQLALSVACVVALVVSSVCLLLLLLQRRRRPCATIKKVAAVVETRERNNEHADS